MLTKMDFTMRTTSIVILDRYQYLGTIATSNSNSKWIFINKNKKLDIFCR